MFLYEMVLIIVKPTIHLGIYGNFQNHILQMCRSCMIYYALMLFTYLLAITIYCKCVSANKIIVI